MVLRQVGDGTGNEGSVEVVDSWWMIVDNGGVALLNNSR